MREAELKAKTAGLASFNEYLQAEVRDLRHLNASLLANNKSLLSSNTSLLASNTSLLASNAQKDKQLQPLQEKLVSLLADSPDLRRVLSREGAE